jgi:hypothetical protein
MPTYGEAPVRSAPCGATAGCRIAALFAKAALSAKTEEPGAERALWFCARGFSLLSREWQVVNLNAAVFVFARYHSLMHYYNERDSSQRKGRCFDPRNVVLHGIEGFFALTPLIITLLETVTLDLAQPGI